jgi:Acyl-CoA synthetases (AMP-forming)/AMP-acid ligases II
LLRKSALRNYKFPALRYVTQAGGGMAPDMIQEFLSILPKIKFYVMYGQTEASARLSYLEPDVLNAKIGSIGKAIPGVELDVVDEKGARVACDQIGEMLHAEKMLCLVIGEILRKPLRFCAKTAYIPETWQKWMRMVFCIW